MRVDSESSRRASWLELFFDLVLVAAIGALAALMADCTIEVDVVGDAAGGTTATTAEQKREPTTVGGAHG